MAENTKYVVLFNGPPRSGKDTLAKEIQSNFHLFQIIHFAEILKNMTHHMYGLSCSYDAFEEDKDAPLDIFFNKTPRQCYIQMSEHYIKPLYSESFFVERLVEQINKSDNKYFIVPDCGFDIEVEYLSKQSNIKCIYVILEREGKDFKNDSRNYINLELLNPDKDSYIHIKNKENMLYETGAELYNRIKEFLYA